MSNNYHTPIVVGAAANAGTVNTPLGAIDAALTTTIAEMLAARGGYANLDARIDNIIAAGGNVSAVVSTSTATTTVPVGAGEGTAFTVGGRVGYTISGSIRYNTIAGKSANSLTLGTSPGGTITSSTIIFQIGESEYQASQVVNAAASGVTRTLPTAIQWAAADKFNVLAYGADPTGATNAQPGIQAAVDAAEANGSGVVEIPQGSYTVDDPIKIDSAWVTIMGIGQPEIVASATFDSEETDPEGAVVFVKDTHHVNVIGLTIKAGDAIASAGIMIRDSNHCVISRCRVLETVTTTTQSGMGIGIYADSKYNRVEYCDVIDVAYSALNIARDDTPSSNPPVGNVLFANYISNPAQDGIDLYQHNNTICAYNRVEGVGRYGINPTGGTGSFPNVDHLFIGNLVRDGALIGIYLHQHTYRCRVIGNYCEANGTSGIASDDATNDQAIISGNVCYNNGDHGIVVGSIRTIVEGNQCIENGSSSADAGINVFGSGDKSIIKGNHCAQNDGSGITVNTVDQVVVEGNYCEANTQYGIEVLSGVNHKIDNNYVLDNAAHGIFLSDVSNSKISGNFVGGSGTGLADSYNNLHISGNSDLNFVMANKFHYGFGANKSFAAIRVQDATCNDTWIGSNDINLGGNVAGISDAGTNTMITPENRDTTRPQSGAWTPGFTFGGGNTGMTFSVQNGSWTRHGKTIHARCYVVLSAKGSSTGDALLTGLPYAAANVANQFYAANLRPNNLVSVSGMLAGYLAPNTTTVTLSHTQTGTTAHLTEANFANNTEIMLNLTYEIA